MINLAVINIKEVIKYLVKVTIIITVVVALTRYFSTYSSSIVNKISDKTFLNCLDETIPGIKTMNKKEYKTDEVEPLKMMLSMEMPMIDSIKKEIPIERPVKLGTKLKNIGVNNNIWNEYEMIDFQPPKTFTLKRLNGDYFVKYTCTEKGDGTEFEYFEWAENELDGLMEMEALEKLKKLIEEQ